MKLSVILVFAMMATSVNSQYINQIIDEEKEGVYYSTSYLTETHLYYQTQKNTDISLWSMDLTTKKKEKLVDSLYDTEGDDDTQAIDYIKTYRDQIYFSHINESYDRYLWLTDGTKTGTQRVNNTRLNSGGKFGVFKEELFAENIDMYLIQLRNNVFITHDIKHPSLDHICVFSEDDFIIQSRNAAADTFTLNRIKGSTKTAFYTYSSTYDDDAGFETYNDSCLFTHTANGMRKVMNVPENGDPNFISELENVSSIKRLINHLGRIYISSLNTDSSIQAIHRLSEDLIEIDASIEINDVFSIQSISSENHLLNAVIEYKNSGGLMAHTFFDKELNGINTPFKLYNNLNQSTYSSDLNVTNIFNDDRDDAVIQTINSQNNISLLSIKNHYITEVITNSNSTAIYLVLYDRNLGAKNIYSLNDQPPINNSINGTWHEYDIINQGLVIQKGKRHDSSDYIFVTLFVFDQGQPLWLAGVSELALDQKTINIDLYKYDGIQMFEYDTAPTQELYAQISMNLANCNTLNLTFSSETYNQSLPLYRIDDTSYRHLCPEVKAINPDNYTSNSIFKGQINE